MRTANILMLAQVNISPINRHNFQIIIGKLIGKRDCYCTQKCIEKQDEHYKLTFLFEIVRLRASFNLLDNNIILSIESKNSNLFILFHLRDANILAK